MDDNKMYYYEAEEVNMNMMVAAKIAKTLAYTVGTNIIMNMAKPKGNITINTPKRKVNVRYNITSENKLTVSISKRHHHHSYHHN